MRIALEVAGLILAKLDRRCDMLPTKARRWWIGGGVVGCTLLAIGSASTGQDRPEPADGETKAKQPASKQADQPRRPEKFPGQVVSTHQLMELFNKPVYKALSESLQSEPQGEKSWDKVEQNSIRAAEVANLIALREAAGKFPEWNDHAMAVQESALQVAQSAKARSYSAARTAFVGMVRNCNSCHQATKPDHAPRLTAFDELEQAKRGSDAKKEK
jgi:hypothetical protein